MLRGIVGWITPGNKRSYWKANLGASPDRPNGVEIVEGKKRTQPASNGDRGPKLCLHVATIKQRTTQSPLPCGQDQSLQTPVERSERLAGCWAVRAGAHPLSLGVWHFTLRFVLPRSWVGYPSPRPKGCGMQSPFGPKVYPKKESDMSKTSIGGVLAMCPRE